MRWERLSDGGCGVDFDNSGGGWSSEDAACAMPGEEPCLLRDVMESEEERGTWTKADDAGRRENGRRRGNRTGRKPRMAA